MKIYTITLNPALDKTILSKGFEIAKTNSVDQSIENVAGKGINVSKNLDVFKQENTIMGIFAGKMGDYCLSFLPFGTHVIVGEGETRTNLKIVDENGLTTELNEQGPRVKDVQEIIDWFDKYAGEDTCFVFSGSLPKGLEPSFYKDLIELVKSKGAIAILDTSKEALIHGLKAIPDIVKPNMSEIQSCLNLMEKPTLKQISAFGYNLIQKGVKWVVVSCGEAGAYFMNQNKIYHALALDLNVKSTVGAGDAMVASLTYSYIHHEDDMTLIKRAIATSGAAVETEGTMPGSLDRIEALMHKVMVKEVL